MNFDEYFSGYDPSYELYDYRSWCGYSDSAFLFIFEKEGEFFILDGGSSPFGDSNTKFDDIYKVDILYVDARLNEWDIAFNGKEPF